MPEATAFRVDLLASQRAGRVRALARWLTLAAAVACGSAALLAPSSARTAATLAAIGAAALAFFPGRATVARQLAVDADGTIRAGADDAGQPAVVRYFGRHLVCLATPAGLLAVWPDSLPRAHWRRLLVACRWQRRQPADSGEASSGLRTK